MTTKELKALKRFNVVSRWHDYLEFQGINTYRMVGEEHPEGEWVRWSDLQALCEKEPKEAPRPKPSKPHALTCPVYGNYQPPYEECNCGAE